MWCMYWGGQGAYRLASPGSIECQTYSLSVKERMHNKRSDLHLLRIVKIVLILLLQGGIQPVLGAKVGYAARDTLTDSQLRLKFRGLI